MRASLFKLPVNPRLTHFFFSPMPQFFICLYGTSTPAPENLWFRELCSPDLHKDGATSATEQERRQGQEKRARCCTGAKLWAKSCSYTQAKQAYPCRGTGSSVVNYETHQCLFSVFPMHRRQAVPWHCHHRTCNSLTLLRSATLFPHSLILCECTWVLLSLGLLCYYLLFS